MLCTVMVYTLSVDVYSSVQFRWLADVCVHACVHACVCLAYLDLCTIWTHVQELCVCTCQDPFIY